MTIGLYVSSLTFSDGTQVALDRTDILVLSGPNNSGKSSALREIYNALVDHVALGPTLSDVQFSDLASREETLRALLDEASLKEPVQDNQLIRFPNGNHQFSAVKSWLHIRQTPLAALYSHYLNTEGRLSLCTPQGRQVLGNESPRNALSVLEVKSEIEDAISKTISDNFGFNLVLNRSGGSQIELRIYSGAPVVGRDQYHTSAYYEWMNSIPRLVDQGDGVKSFTGILLALKAQQRPLILIDEPEAFLHPPQARAIARQIALDAGKDAQVIVATHSDDFIRGFLDAASERAKIIRLQRKKVAGKEVNRATLLDRGKIKTLWTDPLLRTSDLLSGLFHQASIIVEGETDARFLRVLMDALSDAEKIKVPDIKFSFGTGLGSISKICAALQSVSVPTIVVVDPDVMSSREEFEAIVRAQGSDFAEIGSDYSLLTQFLTQTVVLPTATEIQARVSVAFSKLDGVKPFSRAARATIKKAIDIDTGADGLKMFGRQYLLNEIAKTQSGKVQSAKDALSSFDKIISWLAERHIFIYPQGALEAFSVEDAPKRGWLDRVLIRDLVKDPKLEMARAFALNLIQAVQVSLQK
jgi:energy-coupling factor transporter ATP-binding protein EcfA2